MNISGLINQKVAVLGLGKEGLATLKYLIKHQVRPVLLAKQVESQWNREVLQLAQKYQLETHGGDEYLSYLIDVTVAFRSPGIPYNDAKIQKALNRGLILTSQTKWFFNNTLVPIIGVTGTKGKGTTSSLIYESLKLSGKYRLFFTGNIGNIEPFEFIDDLEGNELIIYELSSFQLQDLDKSPHVGVCLMVTADHLDIHKNLVEYHAAKSAITKFQTPSDISIANIDYQASNAIGHFGSGAQFFISSRQAPTDGVLIERDLMHFYRQGRLLKTIDCSDRIIKGQHNMENVAAAYLAVQTYQVTDEEFLSTLQTFKGLEHRLEFIREVAGVKYYNDSISTVPDTTIAAIDAFEDKLILLLGGSSKGLAMDPLINKIINTKNIKALALMGDVGLELQAQLLARGYTGQIIGPSNNFEQIFEQCSKLAYVGDVVLMSPGATSFGMFKNYSERGSVFKKLVNNLSNAKEN